MRRGDQRRRSWAIGVSLGVHAVLLAGILLQRWSLDAPPELPAGPPEPIIPVLLVPHAPMGAKNGTLTFGELKLHRREPHAATSSLPAAARPLFVAPDERSSTAQAPPAAAAPSPSASATPSGGGGASGLPGPVGPDVRMALRKGLGCANLAGLSREDRQACDDQLATGFKTAPVLSQGRDPRIQAYYDAVAKAKAPDKPWTPIRAIGAMGVEQDVPRASNDRVGGVGCVIPFGPKPKLPSHWLKLGPCFIAPPKGPFTTEVDITPPDQDLSHPPPRSGPQAPPGVRHENAAGTPISGPTLVRDHSKDADGETPPR
ncbi:MAG: hypothetical protein JSR98_03270 [Proteobacteria bacterium]|nr:hypothetical protein [Pseudomonadota bacterium]